METLSIVTGVQAGVFLVMGLLSLLFAWGLWRLQRWACRATVIIQVISLANSVITLTQANATVAASKGGMIFPIVILSIHTDRQTRLRALATRAVAFVEKRGTIETLLAAIRQAAGQTRKGLE